MYIPKSENNTNIWNIKCFVKLKPPKMVWFYCSSSSPPRKHDYKKINWCGIFFRKICCVCCFLTLKIMMRWHLWWWFKKCLVHDGLTHIFGMAALIIISTSFYYHILYICEFSKRQNELDSLVSHHATFLFNYFLQKKNCTFAQGTFIQSSNT